MPKYMKIVSVGGPGVAQSVKCPTLDLSSAQVCEFKPHVGLCADGAEPTWDSLSPSLCPPLKINKGTFCKKPGKLLLSLIKHSSWENGVKHIILNININWWDLFGGNLLISIKERWHMPFMLTCHCYEFILQTSLQ